MLDLSRKKKIVSISTDCLQNNSSVWGTKVNSTTPHAAAWLRWVNTSEVATKLASFFFLHINHWEESEVEDWVCSAWSKSYRKGNQKRLSYLLKSQKGTNTHCDLCERKAMGSRNTSGHLKVWMCQTHLCLLPLVLNPFWSCWAQMLTACKNRSRRKTDNPWNDVAMTTIMLQMERTKRVENIFQFISQSFICVLYHICLNKDRRMYPTKDLLWLYMNGNILFLWLRQKIKTNFPYDSNIKAFGIFLYKANFIGACFYTLKGGGCAACWTWNCAALYNSNAMNVMYYFH